MGKNKKGMAGNEQEDGQKQKPKKGKKKKDEEGSKKVARELTRKSSGSMQVARMKPHSERKSENKLRRLLRNNPPGWAGDWAERNNSFDVLRRISRESTSVGEAAKAALASKGKS